MLIFLLFQGAGDSGKSTIFKQVRDLMINLSRFHYSLNVHDNVFLLTPVSSIYFAMQIKLLFQTGFDEAELKNYIPVIHANVYQTIKVRNT